MNSKCWSMMGRKFSLFSLTCNRFEEHCICVSFHWAPHQLKYFIFFSDYFLKYMRFSIQKKKKKSWNKAKETLFVIEVFMEWFEEQHTGVTRVWCRLLNPIQHLLYLVNRYVVVLILIFYRAGKKKLILNKQFLFSSLEWKGHLNLLSDSQAAVAFSFTCSGLFFHLQWLDVTSLQGIRLIMNLYTELRK